MWKTMKRKAAFLAALISLVLFWLGGGDLNDYEDPEE